MKLIFFGAPGSGKGTQSKIVAKKLNIPHLSTGEILREAIKNKTEVGLEASKFMDQGNLVPDSVIVGVVRNRLLAKDCERGYILDGFPRTIGQAEVLDRYFIEIGSQICSVIYLEVDHDQLIERLSGRRICSSCGEEYHIKFRTPIKDGFCDLDNQELIHRPDDYEDQIRKRLINYEKNTQPLIEYYKSKGCIIRIKAVGEVDQISKKIFEEIGY